MTSQEGLAESVGVCRTTLWKKFLPFWNIVISPSEINQIFLLRLPTTWVLGLDGMWLHRFGAVMIYRDVTTGTNLYWSWVASESSQNLLEDFYQVYLLSETTPPSGVISDWKKSIVSHVSSFFPEKPHQRCLAHLIREGKRLCPSGSPYIFTLKLRAIIEELMLISNPSDYFNWSVKLSNWIRDYGSLLKTRTHHITETRKWWYTHGNLRRAVRLLTKDQDNLFLFLHHPFLPKTNNSLEGVNSQLKRKLGNHRGMKPRQQISFCFWLLAFSRVKSQSDLKKLWDKVRRRL